MNADERRAVHRMEQEIYRLLTQDSEHQDRRRRDFNQAIFLPQDEGGHACFNGTNLAMVMEKVNQAARNLLKGRA